MALGLDVLLKQMPCQEAQRNLAVPIPDMVDIDRINDLLGGHQDICKKGKPSEVWSEKKKSIDSMCLLALTDGSEVFLETVSDKNTSQVKKHAQFFVRHLEWYQCMFRRSHIQVFR